MNNNNDIKLTKLKIKCVDKFNSLKLTCNSNLYIIYFQQWEIHMNNLNDKNIFNYIRNFFINQNNKNNEITNIINSINVENMEMFEDFITI